MTPPPRSFHKGFVCILCVCVFMGLHVYLCGSQWSTLDVIILGVGPPFFFAGGGGVSLRILLVSFSPALGLQADTASTLDIFMWVLGN